MTYKIEVKNPTSAEWVLLELIEISLIEIASYVQKIKRIYPEYLVRAYDTLRGNTVVLI
jgi:hypothetical protein